MKDIIKKMFDDNQEEELKESKLNEQPEDPRKPMDEPEDDKVLDRGEEEEPEMPEAPMEDPEEDAAEIDFEKLYLGRTEETHFYLVADKSEHGEAEDLKVVDQEGNLVFSAAENNLEITDVRGFIETAIDETEIAQIERNVVMQYIIPAVEVELAAEEEEDEILEPDEELDKKEPEEEEPKFESKEDKSMKNRTDEGKMGVDYAKRAKTNMKAATAAMKEKDYEAAANYWTAVADESADAAKALGKMKLEADEKAALDKEKEVSEEQVDETMCPKCECKMVEDAEKGMCVCPECGGVDESKVDEKDAPECPKCGNKHYPFQKCPKGGEKPEEKKEEKDVEEGGGSKKKKVKENDVDETLVKDDKGNSFSVNLVDENENQVSMQVNNRTFNYKADFAALFGADEFGKITDEGLQDLALETLSHLDEIEYAELVGSGKPNESKEVKEGTFDNQYVAQDGKTVTDDYNDAGFFELEQAAQVCQQTPRGVISPDASGKWIVLVPSSGPGVDEKCPKSKKKESKTVDEALADKLLEEGTKVKYGDKDAEVSIKEGNVSVTVVDDSGASVNMNVTGDAAVNVDPSGTIMIDPVPGAPVPEPGLGLEEPMEEEPVVEPEMGEELPPEEEEDLPFESKTDEGTGREGETKDVFNVKYVTTEGETKETRVTGYDEADAKKYLLKKPTVEKVTDVKKVTSEGAEEDGEYPDADSGSDVSVPAPAGEDEPLAEGGSKVDPEPFRENDFLAFAGVESPNPMIDEVRVSRWPEDVEVVAVIVDGDSVDVIGQDGFFQHETGGLSLAKQIDVPVDYRQLIHLDFDPINFDNPTEDAIARGDTFEGCKKGKSKRRTKEQIELDREMEENAEAIGGQDAVSVAEGLLGIQSAPKISEEAIQVGDVVQICTTADFKCIHEEIEVKAIDEKKGVEVTGSEDPEAQMWFGSDFYEVYKV
jgi:hypothetical protein